MQSNGLVIQTRFNKKEQLFVVQFTYPALEPVLGEGGTEDDALKQAWDNLAIQLDIFPDERLVSGFDRVVETYLKDTMRTEKRRFEKAPSRRYT